MAVNSIRFTGLASGLDTESMVKALTMREQGRIDTSIQNKLLMEMKRDVYKSVSKDINNFYLKFAGNARLESSFYKVKTTNSNPTLVTVNSGTKSGTSEITNITQLAESAKLDTTTISKSGDTTLKDLGIAFTEGEDIVLTVNDGSGEKYIKLTEDMTLDKLAKEIDKAMPNANVSYDSTAKAFFVSTKNTGSTQKLNLSVENISKDADGKEIKTLNSSVLKQLGLSKTESSSIEKSGINAELVYNGIPISSESNTINVNGLSFTLNGTTTGTEKITIGANQDTDAIFDYVKEFIGEYNKLVGKLNTLVDAKPNKDYKPLTDEQKKEMSENDIKLWNDKINEGILSKDPILKGILGDMRNIMSGVIDGVGMLSDIGISSGSWQDKGVLTIDEEKLRKAIDTNPDKIMQLLAGPTGEKGIADRLYENLDTHFKGISGVKTSISVFNDVKLDKSIADEIESARKLQIKLETIQDMHYKKFTAMEKMLQQLNNQSSWLMGQMGN